MIFFIFGILALLAAFCLFRSEYKAAAMIPGALAVVLVVISCVSFVPTGYTGIVTTFGKVENGTKDAGVVVKAPWQSIVKMDNRVQDSVLARWGAAARYAPAAAGRTYFPAA